MADGSLPHETALRGLLSRYPSTSDHFCERESPSRLRCTAILPALQGAPSLELDVIYNTPTASIMLALRHVATAPPQGPRTPALLRRLAELNYETLGVSFAWNPVDGEVRLSSVFPAETTLDEAALYRCLHALITEGRRRAGELRR